MKIKMDDINNEKKDPLHTQQKLEKEFADYHKEYIQRNVRNKLSKSIEENLEIIEKFRDRWNIPQDGHKTGKTCRSWWKNLPPEIKSRRRLVLYHEEEHLIYIKHFNKVFFDSEPKSNKKKIVKTPRRSLKHVFEYEIYELMADCEIDPFLYHSFEYYLLYDEVNMNFLFHPGFLISIKVLKGEKNKILSEHASIVLSANTRLRDISKFCFPLIKHIQKHLLGYKEYPDRISKEKKIDYQLGFVNISSQTKNAWLVSSGYVHYDNGVTLTK